MITAVFVAATLLAEPAVVPAVAVIDVPAALTASERAPLPAVPSPPQAPQKPPASETREDTWAAYREAEVAHTAAVEQYRAAVKALDEAKRAQRADVRARARVDRAAASMTTSVESAVRRLAVFEVRTARQVKASIGDALVTCAGSACADHVAGVTAAAYVVTISGTAGEPLLRLVLGRSSGGGATKNSGAKETPTVETIGTGELAPYTSARAVVPEMFKAALAMELTSTLLAAKSAGEALDWSVCLEHLGRALRIDDKNAVALFMAGRAFFELGDLRSAERRFREALALGEQPAEANHYLGLAALRRRRESTAADHFVNAIAGGRDSFDARLLLGRLGNDLEHLSAAVKMKPNHGEANYLLAMAQLAASPPNENAALAALGRAAAADYRAADANFEMGSRLAAAGELARARPHFEAARDGGRTSGAALLILGRQYEANEPRLAVSTLAEARRRGERSPDLDFLLGRAAVKVEDYGAAVPALKRAVKHPAHAADANVLLARSYAANNNVLTAADYYAPAIELGRDSYKARVTLGRASMLRGRSAPAMTHFRAALKFKPNDGAASWGLGEAALVMQDDITARTAFEAAIANGVQPAVGFAHLGRIANRAGNRGGARAAFLRAVKAGNRDVDVHRGLARIAKVGHRVARWQKVLELVPRDAEASFELGRAHQAAGRFESAMPKLEHAARSSTYRAAANALLAQLFTGKDAKRALGYYEEALRYGEPTYALLASAGWVAREAGRDDRARYFLSRALAFRPGDGKIGFALGELFRAIGQLTRARAFYRVALESAFRPGETRFALGTIASATGDRKSEEKHFLAAVKAGISRPEAWLGLGDAAARRGNTRAAADHFAKALKSARDRGEDALVKDALARGRGVAPKDSRWVEPGS